VTPLDPAAIETRFDRVTDAVAEERRRVTDELDALRTFAEHVEDSEPKQAQPANVAPAVELSTGGAGDTLETVRRAYESTFMSVPHYDDDYGEQYARSLAAEFGPGMAGALVEGSQFTPACKKALLGAVSEAVTRREQLADALTDEQSSVAEARHALVALAEELVEIYRSTQASQPVGILDAHDARLGVLAEKCDRLLDQRQATIVEQRRSLTLPIDEFDIPSYVYSDIDTETRYPVLGALAECTETLDELRGDVKTALEQQGYDPVERESTL
jgi:uncharacterized coiled-coil protein SlyX